MQETPNDIKIFLALVALVILLLVAFIITLSFLYRKRQMVFEKTMAEVKDNHEKTLLSTQLEMQEQTFKHIAREIHDNISLSLSLAKLQLNTFNWDNQQEATQKINQSVDLLTSSILELNQLSKGLNSDIIIQQGLLTAVAAELERIKQAKLFTTSFIVTGTPIFLSGEKELIIFRIIQEAFNNIIKHAHATEASLVLHYNTIKMVVTVTDNGRGFNAEVSKPTQAGLANMQARVKILGGKMNIQSQPGTTLTFTIPFSEQMIEDSE